MMRLRSPNCFGRRMSSVSNRPSPRLTRSLRRRTMPATEVEFDTPPKMKSPSTVPPSYPRVRAVVVDAVEAAHRLEHVGQMAERLLFVLRRLIAHRSERAEGRHVGEKALVAEAADVERRRRTGHDAQGCVGRVFRQAERRGHVVGRAHRDVAERRRIRHLHQTGHDLAERAVAADAGHGVILRRVLRRHQRRIAASLREVHRRQIAAAVENVHHFAKAVFVAAASGHGVDDQHHAFFHSQPPVGIAKKGHGVLPCPRDSVISQARSFSEPLQTSCALRCSCGSDPCRPRGQQPGQQLYRY